jgi:hypothetical protein
VRHSPKVETALAGLIDALTEEVAARLAARNTRPAFYTSNRRGPNLPGRSQLWCVRNMRHIPGAQKVGRDWVLSEEDYAAWVRSMASDPPRPQSSGAARMLEDDELAKSFLATAGLSRAG